MSLDLSPAFFDLQFRFADAIAQRSQLSFAEALLNYTNLYVQFVSRAFDPLHPIWQDYLSGQEQAEDRVAWSYDFYQLRKESHVPSPYGCFQFNYLSARNTIRCHFVDADTSGYGPLSRQRMPVRLQELKTMFTQIKKLYGTTPEVRGNSWLYNLVAYKRLFPLQYTHTMSVVADDFKFLSLWGQFLRRDGCVHEHLSEAFLACLCRQKTLNDLLRCFPYRVLAPQCNITIFYDFYEI